MKYKVRLADSARNDVEDAYHWLAERTNHAGAWLNGLEKAIDALADYPTRWPLARETREFDESIRQMLYGKSPHIHRVLFVVQKDTVHVLHMRHGARRPLPRGELRLPGDH